MASNGMCDPVRVQAVDVGTKPSQAKHEKPLRNPLGRFREDYPLVGFEKVMRLNRVGWQGHVNNQT